MDPNSEKSIPDYRNITLDEIFKDYLQSHPRLTAHTVADYKRHLIESYPDWCSKRITEISKDMVARRHH